MKKIHAALISVFYKDGLEPIVKSLHELGVKIYSTGGTQEFIEKLGIKVIPVESLTGYPSILGGRVKTLHPAVFGGILGKRDDAKHVAEMAEYKIPEIDLVIVDLYPFEEAVAASPLPSHKEGEYPASIIEKIDIGGPSMIRGAAKNHKDVMVVANKKDYALLETVLREQNGETSLEQRRVFAIKAFDVCAAYDNAISNYFHQLDFITPFNKEEKNLRYGENPHQKATFFGNIDELFEQLNGKALSYNNLVDVDAAVQLISEFPPLGEFRGAIFAIIKHTNVCGISLRETVKKAWDAAHAGDPESAFGGVLVCNGTIDRSTAEAINEIFFEVLIAPGFDEDALQVLRSKKNRILLRHKTQGSGHKNDMQRSILNGVLLQNIDEGNYAAWKEAGGRETTDEERSDLVFANLVCKHLKSNAIALVKNKQLIGKGCGQTSRVDALRQALEKARQFNFDLQGAVLASDAFFPFDDCVKIAHQAGITAFIQPGGSVRDKDSINYCVEKKLAMVMTDMRHFRH